MKKFFIGFALGALVVTSFVAGAGIDRLVGLKFLDRYLLPRQGAAQQNEIERKILTEESAVIDAADTVSPSVVTVSVTRERQVLQPFFMDPFGFFQFQRPGRTETQKLDIGSGFVIDPNAGLVVTNKHVVSETAASYTVITKDDQEHAVSRIYRDPTNDIAILKVDGLSAPAIEMGNSDQLKVGQFVIAIGTALGEFRHTVTTGVISGLGRGIQAGDPFGGVAEELDNVIQTDAAINPGNSGGPLLNSAGQVIGVNVAVSQSGQNIGFALPINIVKQVVDSFQNTGQFERAFFGVRYQMISKDTALANDVPAGAYIVEIVVGSPAADAGLEEGDIVTKFSGEKITDVDGGLASLVNKHKSGDVVGVEYFRDGKTETASVTLTSQ